MDNIIPMLPKKAHVMTFGDIGTAHSYIQGFEPELPKKIWFVGVSSDRVEMPDAVMEEILRKGRLVLNTQCDIGECVADYIRLGGNEFVSRGFRELLEEFEPGVHRAFAVRVVSKLPIGGKTEHGIFTGCARLPLSIAFCFHAQRHARILRAILGRRWISFIQTESPFNGVEASHSVSQPISTAPKLTVIITGGHGKARVPAPILTSPLGPQRY